MSYKRFLTAFNILMGGRDEVLANCRLAQGVLCDCSAIETELAELHREIEIVSELIRKAIYENARFAINQDEFNERYKGYMERHRIAKERVAELEAILIKRREKHKILESFIRDIKTRPLLIEEFDEKLWSAVIDKVMVLVDGRLEFCFKDCTRVEA